MQYRMVFDNQKNEFKKGVFNDEELEPYLGIAEFDIIDVDAIDSGAWKFKTTQYYGPYGYLKMEITQPLERASKIFAAALAKDSEIERQ